MEENKHRGRGWEEVKVASTSITTFVAAAVELGGLMR